MPSNFNEIGVPYTRGPYRGPSEVTAENKKEPKIFNCEKCDKIFKSKQNLSEHENAIHKGLKLHKCEICDQTFRFRNYLYAHKKSEHPKIPNILSKNVDKNEVMKFKRKFQNDISDTSLDDRNGKFSEEIKINRLNKHGTPLKTRH